MRVLWITNIIFPELEGELSGNRELKSSGGWMLSLADGLVKQPDIELHVATVSKKVNQIFHFQGRSIWYHVLPLQSRRTKYNTRYEKLWKELNKQVKPDIVHIHGSEYPFSLAYVRANGNQNVVLSIQGLVSIIAEYYIRGLNVGNVIFNMTIGDLLHCGGLLKTKRDLMLRGKSEIELIKEVNHIIGRTDWDRAHVWAINPSVKYHFCHEVLRSEFYSGCWTFEKCRKHSIFLSQSNSSIKGLHMLLSALPYVRRFYPDVTVRIAGQNIIKRDFSLRSIYAYSGYSKIISNMIHRLSLENCVTFVGPLNAEEMKAEYLSANLFVLPSAIENSPNSLGEAQLLGVPFVSSFVGGVQDMVSGDNCGKLYRFEEVEMLAYYICYLFENSEDIDNSSMREIARERHSVSKNVNSLLRIYRSIV